MKKEKLRKPIVLSLLLIFLILPGLKAQEVIPVTGSEGSGSGGTVSYTVGQMVHAEYTGIDGSVTHGVQQAYEISIIIDVKDIVGMEWLVSVYPNPATDHLLIDISDNYQGDNLQYTLYDSKGIVLLSDRIQSNQTTILMHNYVPSTYFIKILTSIDGVLGQELKVFKIIKK